MLIPVQAAYLPAKGLEQLLETINKVRRQINPKLKIEGILLTMVDSRTNYSKDISNLIRESYGGKLKVYKTDIPRSVRAEEISAEGASIFFILFYSVLNISRSTRVCGCGIFPAEMNIWGMCYSSINDADVFFRFPTNWLFF